MAGKIEKKEKNRIGFTIGDREFREWVFIEPPSFVRRRVVVVAISKTAESDGNVIVSVAYAQRSPFDQFSKAQGHAIARSRARQAALEVITSGLSCGYVKFSKAVKSRDYDEMTVVSAKVAKNLAGAYGFLRNDENTRTREEELELAKITKKIKLLQEKQAALILKNECPDAERLPRMRV